jgi:hypothetical protein
MEPGIEFQIIWSDNDALSLRVAAWNGSFGGVAEIYVAIGDLQVAARQLRGFPNNPADKRVIDFGSFDRKYAGGSVSMSFHCVDGAGHAFVEVMIDSNVETAGTVQTAMVSLPIEAAAMHAFVVELAALEMKRDRVAWLRGGNGAARSWG